MKVVCEFFQKLLPNDLCGRFHLKVQAIFEEYLQITHSIYPIFTTYSPKSDIIINIYKVCQTKH